MVIYSASTKIPMCVLLYSNFIDKEIQDFPQVISVKYILLDSLRIWNICAVHAGKHGEESLQVRGPQVRWSLRTFRVVTPGLSSER